MFTTHLERLAAETTDKSVADSPKSPEYLSPCFELQSQLSGCDSTFQQWINRLFLATQVLY